MHQSINKNKPIQIRISVRDLVEQVLKSGDLFSAFISPQRAIQGTRGHQTVQKSRGNNYQAEIPIHLSIQDTKSNIVLTVHGRIDGLYKDQDRTIIEEIKTTNKPLDRLNPQENHRHFCQTKIYAYLFAVNNHLENIGVDLTYFHLGTRETRIFSKQYSIDVLKDFFEITINTFLDDIREIYHWYQTRNQSIQSLEFPFPTYRQGQETLINEVHHAIADGCRLFAQAPTGLGKTISVLLPSIKALGQGRCEKIFYLTARTTTRETAEQTLDKLRDNGLRLKSITITAKEKICFKNEKICNPNYCEYIRNYYDRLEKAIKDIFVNDHFRRENIEAYARSHEICPFEYSLDLSLAADCIICDYNYVFDPRIRLARYFSEGTTSFLFLVDEAHNLVERSRDMFSTDLEKKEFLQLKRQVDKKEHPKLYDCLQTMDRYLLEWRKDGFENKQNFSVGTNVPDKFIDYLTDFIEVGQELLSRNEAVLFQDEIQELYFRSSFFIKINQLKKQSEAYAVTSTRSGSDLKIKLQCLDASKLIGQMSGRSISTIFFSATLQPTEYFFQLLGGTEEDRFIQLPSPFPAENLCLNLIDTISTKYRDREKTYDSVAEAISLYVEQKQGNYLVFFPSFQYLEEIYARCTPLISDVEMMRQERYMKEPDRELFLADFTRNDSHSRVGFVVMGGIFAESIDLPGDQLTGVAIVGVGLPQVNKERNLLRDYFDSVSSSGFHYAYTFPGMNKVLQAAGRLIRTESDKGSLLLIDDRFSSPLYQRLYPTEWQHMNIVKNSKQLSDILKNFWQSHIQ